MGLVNRSEPRLIFRFRPPEHWQFALLLVVASLVVAVFGDTGRELLRYDRISVASGQFWRFFTANLTHLGGPHLLLNLVGLVLIWSLVGAAFTLSRWLVVTLICVLCQSAGFWFIDTELVWYVGLSGLLHGLLAAGALSTLKTNRVQSVTVIVVLALKIAYEQFLGPLPGSEVAASGPVIVNAHAYGGFGGIVAGVVCGRGGQR